MKKLTAFLVFLPLVSFAGCFPETTFFIDAQSFTGITQEVFSAQLDAVFHAFAGEVAKRGYNLYFNRLWNNGTVNSDTDVQGLRFVINSYGGLARYPGMTADAYRLVVCHELGHHLGGAPHFAGESWGGGGPSVEGEADYFATIRCLKETGLSRDRIKAASQAMANVLASLGRESRPSPFTPDRSVVSRTNSAHPRAQCRLDTYLAGNNCKDQGPLSDSDPQIHSCYDYKSMVGVRPRCWFAP